ncbi:small, acid-soluble spore protein, alpha/beta type [Tepidibacillus sp. LV47]|uniref:small, acid-soluble spore protein, alpha/beta type n=1 Tax=Tepidibacillus sp. LV47 TaxID=3398228 RepID=UPI003AB08D63
MDSLSNNNRLLNPKARSAMDQLKYEVAQDLGLDDDIQNRGWENMTTREVGKIGGNMVKRMIAIAEQQMANQQNAQK